MKRMVGTRKLIDAFTNMANRGVLLTGDNITQEDLLVQIIGTIVKVADTPNIETPKNTVYKFCSCFVLKSPIHSVTICLTPYLILCGIICLKLS